MSKTPKIPATPPPEETTDETQSASGSAAEDMSDSVYVPPPYGPQEALVVIGKKLRQVREARSMSLEDLAAMTRISRRSLQRIEEGLLDKLPNLTFVRGFIRNCLEVYGMEESSLAEELRILGGARNGYQPQKLHKNDYAWTTTLLKKETSQIPLLKIVSYVGIAVGLLWAVYLLYPFHTQLKEPTPTTVEAEKVEQNAGFSAGGSLGSTVPTQPTSANQGSNSQTQTPPLVVESLLLEVHSTERTWLRLSIDKAPPVDVLIQKNHRAVWRAESGFRLIIGNTANVRLALNGESIPLKTQDGQLNANLILDRTMLRQLEN